MRTHQYYMENMNCPACAVKIENEIKALPGVENANVDLFNKRIVVKSDKDVFDETTRIVARHEADVTVARSKMNNSTKYTGEISVTIIYLMALIFSKIVFFENFSIAFNIFFVLVYVYTGRNVLKTAFLNMKNGYIYDENFLMSIATIGAVAIGAYEEAAGVMLFYRIGELLEAKAVENSKNTILDTTKFVSPVAHKYEDEDIVDIKPEGIQKGDILLIKPGETVPADGYLLSSDTDFDQSSITGESIPITVSKGGMVISGSSPLSGSVKIKTITEFAESTTSRIIELISNAPQNKSEREKFITKFARYYTPVVVYLALGIVFIPYFLQSFDILEGDQGLKSHIYNGLVFLVISCPCALMLSVPLSFFASIGIAAKRGIIIKGASFLETFKNCKYILFDKTGTLTEGKFEIIKVKAYGKFKENEVLEIASSLESHSTHPIASAFETTKNDFSPKKIEEVPGKGIKALKGKDAYYVGNKKFLDDLGISIKLSENLYNAICLYVIKNSDVIGTVFLRDMLKTDSAATVKQLKQRGIIPVIVSGDNREAVETVASELGIEKYYHSLLPEEKLDILQYYKKEGDKVAAVGDGLNDTALLSYADVGVAMGRTAASLSIDIADIVILGNKLSKLNELHSISRLSLRLSSENITIALGVKIAVMAASVFGLASLWAAVFADVGAALLTVLNSIKIFLWRKIG